MPTLYVSEPGAMVRLSGGSLVVTVEDDPDGPGPAPRRRRVLAEVEPHRLELIALVGRVNLTTEALMLCLEHGIGLAWFSRNGDFRARLVPETARAADLRLRQYQAWADPAARLARARKVVAAKLGNALEVLEDIQGNHGSTPGLERALGELGGLRGQVAACDSPERLLGLEGNGARAYFGALGEAFRGAIGFAGRRRRPAPDPANALLSFGYVLLGNLLAGLLEAHGLDPALGFFHEVRPGRPSLALDLLEELRHPVVDRFVLRGCNLQIFRPEMFVAEEATGGIRLSRDGLQAFFLEWERRLASPLREKNGPQRLTVRDLLRRQVERLVADLRGGEEYAPLAYGD